VSASLFVSNLPPSVTEDMLAVAFGRFGKVLSVKLKRASAAAALNRSGFVEMQTTAEARAAAAGLNASRFEGRLVSVSRAARS
jgi:RNA recognition motif-containing protein